MPEIYAGVFLVVAWLELYVALTRPTTTLVVIHSRPLPAELGL